MSQRTPDERAERARLLRRVARNIRTTAVSLDAATDALEEYVREAGALLVDKDNPPGESEERRLDALLDDAEPAGVLYSGTDALADELDTEAARLESTGET